MLNVFGDCSQIKKREFCCKGLSVFCLYYITLGEPELVDDGGKISA